MRIIALGLVLAFWLGQPAVSNACTLGQDDVAVSISGPDAPGAAWAASGSDLALAWTVQPRPEGCAGRLYLFLDLPTRLRLSGDGFIALLPGDVGPFGLDIPTGRMRVVVPLDGDGPWVGQMTATAHMIGAVQVDPQLAHFQTTGKGLAEMADSLSLVSGPSAHMKVVPGKPRLLAQEAAPTGRPTEVALSADGQFRLDVFGQTFRVTHVETGSLVLGEAGLAPRFSPTGRFLHWFPRGYALGEGSDEIGRIVGEDFVLYDLIAERAVLRLGDLPRHEGLDVILAVDWSPGDALMLLHRGSNCGMALVQPLFDTRSVFVAPGWTSCYSPEAGFAATTPAMDKVALGEIFKSRVLLPLIPGVGATTGSPRVDVPPDTEQGIFQLAGDVRSSLGPASGRSVPLAPQPVPAQTADQAMSAMPEETLRGAVPLDPVPITGRNPDRVAASMADRLFALGIETPAAPANPAWRRDIVDTLNLSHGAGPDFGSYDGDGYLLSASQTDLGLPATVTEDLDRLSAWLIPETSVCAYQFGLPSKATVWTRIKGDAVAQIVQVVCQVGSVSLPQGIVALLLSDGRTPGSATILAERGNEGFPGFPGGVPTPSERLLLTADAYSPWQLWPISDRIVALSAPPDVLLLVDTQSKAVRLIRNPDAALESAALITATLDLSTLVQWNRDGRVILRDFATGDRVADGAYLDDELVLAMRDGSFRWTAEGARYARVKFAGDPQAYDLAQLAPPKGDGSFTLPPQLSLITASPARGQPVTVRATASEGLSAIEIYRDGLLIDRQDLSGDSAEVILDPALLPETTSLSLIARDLRGARSVPLILAVPQDATAPVGRLFAIAVGTDHYDDAAFAPLAQAARDARSFAAAMQSVPADRYAATTSEVLIDQPDMPQALLATLGRMTADAGPQDTLFLQLSGHGFVGPDGTFYLAGPKSSLADPDGTALAWLRLQDGLSRFPGRVIVFLDACHSGAAGDSATVFATNDDALAALTGAERIAVIAASKGRQLSRESAAAGGGFFTTSVVRALSDPDTDTDGDGTLDLEEIYAAAKSRTVSLSDGRQTPWLRRNGLWGDVPVW